MAELFCYKPAERIRVSGDHKIIEILLQEKTGSGYTGNIKLYDDMGPEISQDFQIAQIKNKRSLSLSSAFSLETDRKFLKGLVTKYADEIYNNICSEIAKVLIEVNPSLKKEVLFKNVFLVRHGEYNSSGLTEKGQHQAQLVAEYIKNILGNESTGIISSPEKETLRAFQTAINIGNILGILKVEQDKRLYTKYASVDKHEIKAVFDLCDSLESGLDNIVLVSHRPIVDGTANEILSMIGINERADYSDYGRGHHILVQENRYCKMPN